MIPRAEVIAVAGEARLLPTTVEKDYALGWVLFGIALRVIQSGYSDQAAHCRSSYRSEVAKRERMVRGRGY